MELPEKVLLKIFGFLSTQEIFSKVALVCKRFNLLSKDPNLIKFWDVIFDNEYDFEYIAKVLLRTRNLRQLKIKANSYDFIYENENKIRILLQQALKNNRNIKVLDLSPITITRELMDTVYECGSKIEELTISEFTVRGPLVMEPIDELKHLKHLSIFRLSLNGLKAISDSNLKLEKFHFQLSIPLSASVAN